jgi:glutathione S-transferase
MPTTLYAVPVSNFCATVRLVLRLKGVTFDEMLPPDGYASVAYKRLVPTGTVPALVDDAVVLSESAVIVEYLDARHPEPPLVPAEGIADRARIRWLARLHDTRIEPPLRALFAHMNPARRDAAVVDSEWRRLEARLTDLAAATTPAPFLAGDRVTLADVVYPATLLLGERMAAELGRVLPLPTPLAAWWARLRNEPPVAAMLDGYAPAVADWLATKRAEGRA